MSSNLTSFNVSYKDIQSMSHFINIIYLYYNIYKYIISLLLIIVIINTIYYIYWIYYISSIFHYYQENIALINYYSDISNYSIYNNNPGIEINLSIFEFQGTIVSLIIWSSLIILPWLTLIIIIIAKHFYHIKINYSIVTSGILVITILINYVYIPELIYCTYDYYKIYQIQHESLHFNIEYNIIEIIKYSVNTIVCMGIALVISNYTNLRLVMISLYIITIPWNQPILILIATINCYLLCQEILNFTKVVKLNYLKEIALHCR